MQVLRPRLSALAILAAAWALSAQTASAAPGDLTFRGCISARTDTRCHHHANGLSSRDIAVSPDGKSVYVASYGQSTGSDVATFHRSRRTGRLSPRGCIADANSDSGATGCSRTAPGLYNAGSVVVSPDGASVYVGGSDGTIAEFQRGAHGKLRFVDCAADAPRDPGEHRGDGCSVVRDGIGGDSLAISPDGRFLYATSYGDGSVAEFVRDPVSGQLSFSQCAVASDVPTGAGHVEPTADCGLSSPALYAVNDVAVSPDGADVYVVTGADDFDGYGGQAILRLPRDPQTGRMEAVNCLFGVLAEDCANVPYPRFPYSIAFSPHGSTAYLSSGCCQTPSSDALSRLDRDSAGQLTYGGCIDANAPSDADCSEHVKEMGYADVVVSPDGRSVYVSGGNTLNAFRRHAGGRLRPGHCIGRAGDKARACDRTAKTLPLAMALSPDGRFVYGAGGSVSVFRRNTDFGSRGAPH